MSTFTLDATFDADFFQGSSSASGGTSSEVPDKWECALGSHTYMIDRAADLQGFRSQHHTRASSPIMRNQADVGEIPSEQSINRDGLWRRGQETWHHGAGQKRYDRSDSDPARFRASKNVNVWTNGQATLLNGTTKIVTSANTNLRAAAAGTVLYVADDHLLKFSTNAATSGTPSFTTVTGNPGVACSSLCSDGYNIWCAYGASGVYATTRGAASMASYSATTASVVGFVHNRLMVGSANVLSNITGAGTTTLLTHSNSDFVWVGFAEGPGFIYAAGYSGTKSLIYKITLVDDGTSLGPPIIVASLPLGEIVRSITGYLGFLVIGTDKGFRLGTFDAGGNITLGSLVPTTSPVLCFDAADRFVWYGLSNYDNASTGLGRMDLSVFTQPLTPAYATDLLATDQGSVLSVTMAGDRRVFTISGVGVYAETPGTLCTSGTLSTGRVTYGIGDDKVALYIDLRHEALVGTISAALDTDGVSSDAGTSNIAASIRPSYPLNGHQARGETSELTFTLTANVTSPTLTRWTLRAYPAPPRTITFTIPLLLHQNVQTHTDEEAMDTAKERLYLESLCLSQELFIYREAGNSYTVLMEDFNWVPVKASKEDQGFNAYDGTFVCQLREVSP